MSSQNEGRDNRVDAQTETGAGNQRNSAAGTISINVGQPGNIRKLVLEGSNWTVSDVLKYAEIDATGYDIRVGGQPVQTNSPVVDGQTVLLLRPVRGNTEGGTISVNVGQPGNIRKLVLEGNSWTVAEVLKYAEIDASGYDIRVGGQPVQKNSPVADGQTILLLRPVRGNTEGGTISVNVGQPGNIRKLVLEGNSWTVAEVLKYAEIDASGYDIRVGGQPVQKNSPVADGQTILLLRPVRGN